ncbi:hypothetical protein AAFP30_10190 [Gordonia sp. CPCC 205515]|uniref:hypothetical protein n=1 Tax=Gordonia sp. CPCC 205515 TaxID=3140791 RepID=UPI003AF3F0A1
MFGFVRSAARLLVALVVVLTFLGLATGCGSDENQAPPGAALPKDFPTEQVPLVTGTVLSADGTAAEGWSVTVQAGADQGNAVDAAVTTLTKSGYTESQRTETGAQKTVLLSADKDGTTYWVQVGSTPGAAGGGQSVFYQVTAK